MTEATKSTLASVSHHTRHHTWKFFGAIFMSEKNGVQAVSYHKVLGFILFCCCLYMWMWPSMIDPAIAEALQKAELDVPAALKVAKEIPDNMMHTLWGLLGLNGVNKLASAWKSNGKPKKRPAPQA